ncbi:Catalase C [compost metagenome]
MNLLGEGIKGRKVAVLVADGVDGDSVDTLVKALEAESAQIKLLGPTSAPVKTAQGKALAVDASMEGLPSVVFDALWVPAGKASLQTLAASGVALHFLLEAYKHLKPIGLASEAQPLLDKLGLKADSGLLLGSDAKAYKAFIKAIGKHRVWEREAAAQAIPA